MTKPSTAKSEIKRLYISYLIGFGWSLLFTLAAFALTQVQVDSGGEAYPKTTVIALLLGLAAMQLVFQLIFFFHLGREPKPHLNTVSFLFMLMVVGIIGLGSLWIMYNLNYNMMTGQEVETYIQQEENIYRDPAQDHDDH